MDKKKQTHIPYGFVTALAMIIVGVVLEVTKLNSNSAVQLLGMLPFLIGIILNAQAYSKANDADITFGQAFGSGFKATAIIALVMVAWSVISLFIFPEIQTRALDKAEADMLKKGVSEEQIDIAIGVTRKYFKVFAMAGALLMMLFFGLIFSLIGAAIAKKQPRQQITIQ